MVFQVVGGLPQGLEVPAALDWCRKNALYARVLFDVDSKGKAHKRAMCLTKAACYFCEVKDGTVHKAIRLSEVTGILTLSLSVKKGIVGSASMEPHVIIKSANQGDVLLRLYADKANTPEGNDPEILPKAMSQLCGLLGNPQPVNEQPEGTELASVVEWNKENAVDVKEEMASRLKPQASSAASSPQQQTASPGPGEGQDLAATQSEHVDPQPTVVTAVPVGGGGGGGYSSGMLEVLSEKVRSLEAQLAVATSRMETERQKREAAEGEQMRLKEQLEDEKASREDLVRELRADFDTEFIKKQADEFELRQRQFTRLREKDQRRIKELEEEVAVPKAYSGPTELQQRIGQLEKQVGTLEAKADEMESRSIHYENHFDELYANGKELWHFIQEGALPRIRDLKAGKDPTSLPLLPKLPSQPKDAPPFVYDPANRPKRAAAAAAPAASAGDMGLDLDLGLDDPAPAPAGGDVSVDLDLGDLDLGPGPAGGGGAGDIDLDTDLL